MSLRFLALSFLCLASCFASRQLHADLVLLNEWNAVGSSRFLDGDAFADSTAADTNFGRIQGNGGNWMELLVVGDVWC